MINCSAVGAVLTSDNQRQVSKLVFFDTCLLLSNDVELIFVHNRFCSIEISYDPLVKWFKTPPFHGGNMGSNPVRVILIMGYSQVVRQRVLIP